MAGNLFHANISTAIMETQMMAVVDSSRKVDGKPTTLASLGFDWISCAFMPLFQRLQPAVGWATGFDRWMHCNADTDLVSPPIDPQDGRRLAALQLLCRKTRHPNCRPSAPCMSQLQRRWLQVARRRRQASGRREQPCYHYVLRTLCLQFPRWPPSLALAI